MTASIAAAADADPAVASYEELRHGALTGAPGGGHGGLIVLVREGLAAWLAQGPANATTVRPAAAPPVRPAAPQVLDEVQASVVRVLANMALAGHREVHP